MKIALIQCPGWGRDCPPYSMALLSAILRNSGHQVFCFDLNNSLYLSGPKEYHNFWDDKDLYTFWSTKGLIDKFIQDNQKMIEFQVEQILSSNARIIGFTVHFSSLLVSLAVARMIKAQDKKRIIVFGGPDCCRQLRGFELIKEETVDVVNLGEGDRTILDLVKSLESKNQIDFLQGTLIKRNGGFIDCGDREVVDDLNGPPFPDYSDFAEDIVNGLYRQPERLEILDSRGCITQCHFCSEWQFWRQFRTMSGERMFAEVAYQVKQFPQVDYFYFIGSLINGDVKALSKFCDLIIQHKLRIRWLGQPIIRSEMTKELLQKMKKAGCLWLGYGIESGSQRIVHKMNKKFSTQLAEQVLKETHDAGIQVQANFMFGMPTETEDDFRQTLNFLKRNRDSIDSVLASQSFCVIDKDTYLYNHPEDFGITDRDHHLYWAAGKANTYPERFRRYEEFCKLALSLGIPETSGVLRVKPDKWQLLGNYWLYKKNYSSAIDCFQKALENESQEHSILDKINLCQQKLEKTNVKKIEIRNADIHQEELMQDHELSDKQKRIIQALNKLNLKQKADNFILIERQKLNREEYVQGYPYWLTIDPTNFCNLRCPFCPTGQGRNSRTKAVLSLDSFKRIMDELGPYLIHIDFCNWGEPLLNKQICEMVKVAKQYHIDTKIDSNLNNLSEEDAERLITAGLDKIIVSLDGATQETYAKYRVEGNFIKVMDNLKLLIEKKRELKSANPYITWQFLVFRHNEHEIQKVKQMGQYLGIDEVAIAKAFIGDKDWIPKNINYSNYDIKKIEQPRCQIDKTSLYLNQPRERMCNWVWEAVVINPNGSVSPCCSVEDERDDFGNIFQQPLIEIWNNKKYHQARSLIRDKAIAGDFHNNICQQCPQAGLINLDLFSCQLFSDTEHCSPKDIRPTMEVESRNKVLVSGTSFEDKFINNQELNELELQKEKITLESNPTELMAILTTKCNLRCIMCRRWKGNSILPFEQAKKVFSLFPYLKFASWQGGEVFLLEYFKEIFIKAAQYPNIWQQITTNGLAIDKEWAKIFAQAKTDLFYSIDAVTKSTFESIRCGAKFEDLTKSIELVNHARRNYRGDVKLGINAVVMKRNYKELLLFPDFCKKYNFGLLCFDFLWPDFLPEEDIFIKPDFTAIQYLKGIIPEIEDKCLRNNIEFKCLFKTYISDFSKLSIDDKAKENVGDIDCPYPWTRLHIEPDGKVYPACLCKKPLGDLMNNSWEDIWNGKIMQLYRKLILMRQADKICSQQCKTYRVVRRQE